MSNPEKAPLNPSDNSKSPNSNPFTSAAFGGKPSTNAASGSFLGTLLKMTSQNANPPPAPAPATNIFSSLVPTNAQPNTSLFGAPKVAKDSADDTTPPTLISQSYPNIGATNSFMNKQSSADVKVGGSVMKGEDKVDESFKNRQVYKPNSGDAPANKMASPVVRAAELKVEEKRAQKVNKKIGSYEQLKKQKREISQGQAKLQSRINELKNRKSQCDKQIDAIKPKIKKHDLRIKFLRQNREEDDQKTKKEIQQLRDEIDTMQLKKAKLAKQSEDAAQRLQVQEQDLIKTYYQKSLIIEDELKIAEVYQNLVEEGQRIRRKVIENQREYEERVRKFVTKHEQLQRRGLSEKQMNELLTFEDKSILNLCDNQHNLNHERERLKEKIRKQKLEDRITLEQNQYIFERATFDNYKEFLQFWNHKNSQMEEEEEEELTAQEKNQKKLKLLMAQVPNLKELLFRELQIEKESKERERREEQRREQEEIQRRQDQKLRQQRMALQKAAREQQERKRQEERKVLQEEFKVIQKQVKQLLEKDNFKAEIQKLIISNLQDYDKAEQILNTKSQIIEQALKNDELIREKITKLQSIGQKLGRKRDNSYERKLDLVRDLIYEEKQKKVHEQEQALNIWKQTDRKRRQIQQEEALRQRERLRFIAGLPKKEMYADKIKELKDRIPPGQLQILQKKQKYVNQIKVLIELSKVSKEQMEMNKFDINRYQFLIYEKGKLIDKVIVQEAEGKEAVLSQEFTKIEKELEAMQAIINMSFINNSYDVPHGLLVKTKQDLFKQVIDLEIKDKMQKIAKVESKTKIILAQSQSKQKVLLQLRQKLEEKKMQNEKLEKDRLEQFKHRVYISKKEEEEDRVIPKELVGDPLPNIVIHNKEAVEEYFKLQQPEQLTQLHNEIKKLRDARIKLQQGYNGLLEDSKQPRLPKKKKNPIYLGQIDEDHPKVKKLNEELSQYMKKCQKINANKKNRERGGVSQIRMGISSILRP